ncbi:MAG: glycosyltransferase, partial [Desulfobacteraceae bacterium]|nr:glycosyltransferase [Desulfobacteraceae bacterium]
MQDVFPDNRSGNKREYSPDSLARMFNAGYKIDVAKFLNFIPSSCHQEVQFEFIKSNSESSGPGYNCPTVSIYMAVYNSEKYLAQTLDSILSQTFRDFEIVIADDGSMDNSAEILKRYEKADSRIRVLQLPHVGVVEARNEAIKRCNPNSKYLINHDSDDMSSPTKLARLVEYIETHPEIAIVGCFAEYFDDEGNFKGQPPIEWLPERIRQTFGEVNSMIHSASLISRQVFEKIGSYSKDFPVTQDYDFFARALMAGFKLANIPEVLHKIRLHPKSIGNTHAASVKIATDRVQKNYKSHQQKERASDKPRLIKGGLKLNNALSILHTVEFYSPHVGGAEQVVQQLSERLAKRGHNVTVATTRLAERTFDQLNGVQIEEFDVWGSIARGFTGSDIARYQQFLLKHPADIMMNYAAQQWATDLAFDTLASTSNRRINIIAPCGYSALSDSKTLQDPQFADYFNKVISTYLPKYDAAVYHSGLYQDYEFAQNHGFKNSVIIPNGVCEGEFSQPPKVSFRQKYKIATKYLGLCVANFYPGKGQEKIIECARQMNRPDFTMVFIGKEGSELRKLYELASGLNVSFCVGIERKDTLAAYHEADIFLFGSEKECSPLVIVEAKASRTPFVSIDCGNVREWKGGVVCASEKMAFYANRILDEEVTRKNLAEEGWKDWKEKLTLKSVVDRYEELYLRLHWKKSGSRTKSQLQMPNAKISKGSQKKNEKQAKEDITALIFSKDRALQLQATIESFLLHCQDEDTIDLVVLYKASNELHGGQYTELKKKFSGIDFVEESNFREQVLSAIEKCDYILFLVDDNIFVKPFSMKDISKALQREKDAVGFSLRLGKNTNYCYPFSSQQALPQFKKFSKGILKYYWPDAEYDFGYPLEVSSSVYRCQDMLQLLNRKEFVNPNTLESLMNQNKNLYNSLPYLLTYEESVTFANPVNIVQNVYENKHGTINNYTSEELADCFSQGMAVDVEKYIGFIPNAAHQEAKLHFKKAGDNVVRISVIVPCYNHAHYLPEAVKSIVNQTYKHWECIIVNDESSDNTTEVAKRLIAEYPDRDIRFIDKPNNSG